MTKVRLFTLTAVALLTFGVVFSQDDNPPGAYVMGETEETYRGPMGNERPIDFFEVHNAEIRSVFRQLSSYSGVDIVVGEDVKGAVSLSVSNKTWLEILWIVCRVSNLAAVSEENYIYILSSDEYGKRMAGSAAAIEFTQTASPLRREIIRLNFTTAMEMEPTVEALLSARGKVTMAGHTNALVLHDTEENIRQIRKMIEDLDRPVPQVSISCKIIEVSAGVVQKMGVHWGVTDPQYNVTASHLDPSHTSIITDPPINRITYGMLTPERLGVTLEYLFEDHQGEVVAQPQITTLDNKEARIFMGQQIPIRMLDEAGNTVIQMVNAGTALVVTPHVSGDGKKIMLSLEPRKESYYVDAGGLPVINEQSAKTSVMVNNGETVVIAGLTSNESRNVEAGIPFLKNIPILGHLFKRSAKSVEKQDLIIFVTPHIIHPDM